MHTTVILNRSLIRFGIPMGLFAVLILLMQSSLVVGNDTLSLAITIDLLFTVPFVYFLLIRQSSVPKTTVIPLMVIGLVMGSYFLPKESQTYLGLFKNWALPVIELSILTLVIVKVRKALATYKEIERVTPDFYDNLIHVCKEILPKPLVLPFATEVAVLYYGFIHWKERSLGSQEFTYHKKCGTPSLLGGLILVIVIEAIALHFLLALWHVIIAWIFTGLSIYSAVQVFGFARALAQRPIAMDDSKLVLRYGIMNESQILFSDIEAIVLSNKELEKNSLIQTLSPLGALESHNIVISLKRENTLRGLYGIKKKYKVIGLHIDEPRAFKEAIENALPQNL